jgi:hypothetical protein
MEMIMPPSLVQPAPPILTRVDRPEVSETFVDTLENMTFDGGLVRLDFVANRYDQVPPGAPITGNKVTAARLIIPLPGALGLAASLEALLAQLKQQGIIQQAPTPAVPPKNLN